MDSGKTILNLERVDSAGKPRNDAMLRAVREAAAGVFDLLGELGRNRYGGIVYLGRELATGNLSALRLDVSPNSPNEMELTVVGELDDSIPAAGYDCHFCGQRLDTWGRFCTSCGRDVSGVIAAMTSPAEREQLLAAVKAAAAGEYEILGEMKRARGGGIVYFARELATGHISALRLQRDSSQGPGQSEYSLGKTQVLKPLVEGMEGAQPPPPAKRDDTPRPMPARPNDYVGPALADGRVSELPPPPPPPPVEAPPPPPPRMSTRTLLIGGIAVIFVLAIAAIAVSTGDNNTGVVVNKDTTQPKDTTPPPPPPPVEPQSPPPVVAAVDTGILEIVRLPPGAELTIDGVRRRGKVFRLPVGTHRIVGKAPGHRDASVDLIVVKGPMQYGLRFQPIPLDTTTKTEVRPPEPPTKSPCVVATEAKNWQVVRQACLADANAGVKPAIRSMAVAYNSGGPTDEGVAVDWLQRSADAGNRESQFDLGEIFRRSTVRRDERRAIRLYTLAANAGHGEAAYQLGRMYEKGQGTSKNEREALNWFTKGAELGFPAAMAGAGVYHLKGTGTSRNDAKAREWLEKGAAAGSAAAMYNLGTMYEDGRAGLPKSRATAREWYERAAKLGDLEARRALGRN
jgi:hypothetical protein